MSQLTRVRVRPKIEGHSHHGFPAERRPGIQEIPEWLLIELPPIVPDGDILCDSPLLWRVPEEEIRRLGGTPKGNHYVCIHEVEID
jgi:hypothetical protein